MKCPECKLEQESNGLILWCENGHVYMILSLREEDVRHAAKRYAAHADEARQPEADAGEVEE